MPAPPAVMARPQNQPIAGNTQYKFLGLIALLLLRVYQQRITSIRPPDDQHLRDDERQHHIVQLVPQEIANGYLKCWPKQLIGTALDHEKGVCHYLMRRSIFIAK
jgi:hypothetical protein